MAKQVVNEGDSGLTARGKLSGNFDELYAVGDAIVANDTISKANSASQPGDFATTELEHDPATDVGGEFALALLNFTDNPLDGDQIQLGTRPYFFQDTLNDFDGHVKIGATAADTFTNLAAALIAGAGAGTQFSASTTANTEIRHDGNAIVTSIGFLANVVGTPGNSLNADVSGGAYGTFAGGGFVGGVDIKYGYKAGVVRSDLAVYDVIAGAVSLQSTFNTVTTNYVYVLAGVVASATTNIPSYGAFLLATVDAEGPIISSITDRRAILNSSALPNPIGASQNRFPRPLAAVPSESIWGFPAAAIVWEEVISDGNVNGTASTTFTRSIAVSTGNVLLGVSIESSLDFGGAGINSVTCQVGIDGELDKFASEMECLNAGNLQVSPYLSWYVFDGVTDVKITMTANVDFTNVSTGECIIRFLWFEFGVGN